MQINGRLEAAHKIFMEISLLIMEKSWNNHGILILNFCGNPVIDQCTPYGDIRILALVGRLIKFLAPEHQVGNDIIPDGPVV